MGSAGIDYGMGKCNIDMETGIRYGVISQHSVMPEVLDDLESEYSYTCPDCGNEVESAEAIGWDYFCDSCRKLWESDDCCSDEPIGMGLDDGHYQITSCLDSDLMVIKSEYYTFTQFCSPCVPGAGNLDMPRPKGVKTYCLDSDWFSEDQPCPYPIYAVDTNELVYSPRPRY